MTFRVGQKVVCIKGIPEVDPRDGVNYPVKGRVYTVRWIGQRATDLSPGVMLQEHFGGIHPEYGIEFCFGFMRFRPVVERKTSIEIFTAMLNTSKQGADA